MFTHFYSEKFEESQFHLKTSRLTLKDIKMAVDAAKEKALADYRQKLMEHREVEARLKSMREDLKGLTKQYDK